MTTSTEELRLGTPTGSLRAALDVPDGAPPSSPIGDLRQLGHELARRGIATVRPDRRGIGASAAAARPRPG